MEYRGPIPGLLRYVQKFVVIGDNIRVSEPNDNNAQHAQLANETPNLSKELLKRRNEEPATIDAGFVDFFERESRIELSLGSRSLRLPIEDVAKEARERSITLFQRLSPGYEVKAV